MRNIGRLWRTTAAGGTERLANRRVGLRSSLGRLGRRSPVRWSSPGWSSFGASTVRRSNRLCGDLGAEHRFKLRWHLAPWLISAPGPIRARDHHSPIVAPRSLVGTTARNIRVPVDPTATAAAAETLALHRCGIAAGSTTTVGNTATGPASVAAYRPIATALLGDQVLRDRRLVLVVDIDRRQARRGRAVHPDLAVPERAERRRARGPGSNRKVLLILLIHLQRSGDDLPGRRTGTNHELAFAAAAAAATTTTTTPTATTLALLGLALHRTSISGILVVDVRLKVHVERYRGRLVGS